NRPAARRPGRLDAGRVAEPDPRSLASTDTHRQEDRPGLAAGEPAGTGQAGPPAQTVVARRMGPFSPPAGTPDAALSPAGALPDELPGLCCAHCPGGAPAFQPTV